MDEPTQRLIPFREWKAALVADLDRVSQRDRWGVGLMWVGWSHLAFFLLEQSLFTSGRLGNLLALSLWATELAVNLSLFRRVVGKGWYRSTPLAGILARVWGTFLILSFNVASLNNFTGWSLDWFKPVWASIATFGFMMMAYLIHARFFFFAVQMYFTGLLMVLNPEWNYLIYGVSWWAALQGMGWSLERRRSTLSITDAEEPVPEASSAAA